MKKIFALLLALVMTMSLVACGGNAANDQQDGDAEGSKKIETLKVAVRSFPRARRSSLLPSP